MLCRVSGSSRPSFFILISTVSVHYSRLSWVDFVFPKVNSDEDVPFLETTVCTISLFQTGKLLVTGNVDIFLRCFH